MVKKNLFSNKIFKNCDLFFLDTNILIYFFENNAKYAPIIDEIFVFLESKQKAIAFSSLLLTEILVEPYRQGNLTVAKKWLEHFKLSKNLEIFDLTPVIAVDAAYLRAKYNIKTPDSIHLATAMQRENIVFLTNDQDLKRVKEVKVLCLDDI